MIDPKEEQAEFISLREALFLIIHIKQRTPKEAAELLLRNLRGTNDLQIKGYTPTSGMHPTAGAILREAYDSLEDINNCDYYYEQPSSREDCRIPFSLSYHGFDRSNFISWLCVNPDWAKDIPPSIAKWGLEFHSREYFELSEVACIIEGYNPTFWGCSPYLNVPDDAREMMNTLINSDELEKDSYEYDDGEEFFMAHRDDIAIWCQKRGLYWPLGKLPPMQQPIATAINNAANLGQSGNIPDITGATFARLKQAIDTFSEKYPSYREKPPKLDADIRVWLGKELGCSEREKHVFGQIIAEHFGLIQSA